MKWKRKKTNRFLQLDSVAAAGVLLQEKSIDQFFGRSIDRFFTEKKNARKMQKNKSKTKLKSKYAQDS